jgi:hypothetical protein
MSSKLAKFKICALPKCSRPRTSLGQRSANAYVRARHSRDELKYRNVHHFQMYTLRAPVECGGARCARCAAPNRALRFVSRFPRAPSVKIGVQRDFPIVFNRTAHSKLWWSLIICLQLISWHEARAILRMRLVVRVVLDLGRLLAWHRRHFSLCQRFCLPLCQFVQIALHLVLHIARRLCRRRRGARRPTVRIRRRSANIGATMIAHHRRRVKRRRKRRIAADRSHGMRGNAGIVGKIFLALSTSQRNDNTNNTDNEQHTSAAGETNA